ncbi:hypothetical protein PR048_033447 [Dryococelus australis]|uniref:Uncharacterized protein n=1 Tax=Dryococelus australis TaxID=614101 RepID=A0ABQ9G0A8_9NEOP|nr:hypothetical protein PR048_033447 [Dryococelus australis]
MDPRGNPAYEVKKRGSDTGDTNLHAWRLTAPTRKACRVSVGSIPLLIPNFCNIVTLITEMGIVLDDAIGRWVFSGVSRSPAPAFCRRSIFTSMTLIGSQDLAVKSCPNLITHFTHPNAFDIIACNEDVAVSEKIWAAFNIHVLRADECERWIWSSAGLKGRGKTLRGPLMPLFPLQYSRNVYRDAVSKKLRETKGRQGRTENGPPANFQTSWELTRSFAIGKQPIGEFFKKVKHDSTTLYPNDAFTDSVGETMALKLNNSETLGSPCAARWCYVVKLTYKGWGGSHSLRGRQRPRGAHTCRPAGPLSGREAWSSSNTPPSQRRYAVSNGKHFLNLIWHRRFDFRSMCRDSVRCHGVRENFAAEKLHNAWQYLERGLSEYGPMPRATTLKIPASTWLATRRPPSQHSGHSYGVIGRGSKAPHQSFDWRVVVSRCLWITLYCVLQVATSSRVWHVNESLQPESLLIDNLRLAHLVLAVLQVRARPCNLFTGSTRRKPNHYTTSDQKVWKGKRDFTCQAEPLCLVLRNEERKLPYKLRALASHASTNDVTSQHGSLLASRQPTIILRTCRRVQRPVRTPVPSPEPSLGQSESRYAPHQSHPVTLFRLCRLTCSVLVGTKPTPTFSLHIGIHVGTLPLMIGSPWLGSRSDYTRQQAGGGINETNFKMANAQGM